jgi:hypothetical protein
VRYESALLFHGPGAAQAAADFLPSVGRPVAAPFGECGLKIDEARSVINLMRNAPIGDVPGSVLIGPLDIAAQNATDVLLKCIEEFDPEIVRPVLWAKDLGAVSSTIKSRCLHRWCPDVPADEDRESLIRIAFDLVDASTAGDLAKVIEVLKEGTKDMAAQDIIEASAQALATDPKALVGAHHALWERLRALSLYRNVSRTELMAAFVGGAE